LYRYIEAAAPGACAALLAGAVERLAGPAAASELSLRGGAVQVESS
jgi:hypothetical protein